MFFVPYSLDLLFVLYLFEMVVESRSVIRNVKNARGLPLPPPPFPSRARLIFALLVLIRSHYTI